MTARKTAAAKAAAEDPKDVADTETGAAVAAGPASAGDPAPSVGTEASGGAHGSAETTPGPDSSDQGSTTGGSGDASSVDGQDALVAAARADALAALRDGTPDDGDVVEPVDELTLPTPGDRVVIDDDGQEWIVVHTLFMWLDSDGVHHSVPHGTVVVATTATAGRGVELGTLVAYPGA